MERLQSNLVVYDYVYQIQFFLFLCSVSLSIPTLFGSLGTNMPSKGAINQLSNGNQSNILNQSSVSRGQVPQKPTAPHAQMNQFPQGRNAPQNNVRLPMPMSNNVPFNRPNIPAATAAMAAHIMQQQFIHQAARAHLQAAQILQQQQQQNLLRTQMQAAMAQAYARGQAAKAMMYNPRVVANNLQAVAQQMGLRAPQPGQGMGKPIPTPLLNQPKTDEPKQSEGMLFDSYKNAI